MQSTTKMVCNLQGSVLQCKNIMTPQTSTAVRPTIAVSESLLSNPRPWLLTLCS